MLLLLMIILFRTMCLKAGAFDAARSRSNQVTGIIFLLLFTSMSVLRAHAQEKRLSYNVIKNGTVVGSLDLKQINTGNTSHLKIEVEIKTRLLFLFTLHIEEETYFRDGILIYSSIYRRFNNSEKENVKTTLEGLTYSVNNRGRVKKIAGYPIRFNLLNMYSAEPKQVPSVYCDNFQQFVPVLKLEENKYKVILPDGNYNIFYYRDAVCMKIEVYHSFYSVAFVLKE